LGEFSPIGRLFTLGSFCKISEATQIFGLHFPWYMLSINFDKKMGWAKFGATFSQTHQVTLFSGENLGSFVVFYINMINTGSTYM
jgi:hypothetical protein